jgi:hypothetical protein
MACPSCLEKTNLEAAGDDIVSGRAVVEGGYK